MNFTISIETYGKEIDLDCYVTTWAGCDATREDPGEPGGFEVYKVMRDGDDITSALSDVENERIAEEVEDYLCRDGG